MHSNLFQITSKIASLSRSGFLWQARKLFDEMPSRDTVAWNAMLTGYSQLGLHREALSLFHDMRLSNAKLDDFSFTATLSACAGQGSFRTGTKIHGLVVVLGCGSSIPVNNSLVDMYGKCFDPGSASNVFREMNGANEVTWCSLLYAHANSGMLTEARQVFGLMPERIDVAWNIMISGFGKYGETESCLNLLGQMRESSCCPDQFTYSAVITACAESLDFVQGTVIHAVVIRTGWSSAMEVKNSLLGLYAKLGSLTEAVKVFQSPGILTQVSWNAMIDAYMKSGETQKAFSAFGQMPEKNAVSWTSMISGYAQNGCGEEALNFFTHMVRDGLLPDDYTFGAVLHACSTMALIVHGRMVHGSIMHSGFHTCAYVGNGLVNMYAKCGDLDSSIMAFDDIYKKDVVSFNTMVFALGLHGRGNQALQLYEDMLESGLKPDKLTFIGLLMSCSHSGMVEKGRMLFDSMSSVHSLSYDVDHVACMVDLLGRAGYLSEARDWASNMISSCEALLGACSVHGEVAMAASVGEGMKSVQPGNETSYVLQSNVYCASGQWEQAELLRKAMAEEGLKKPPGCSWIEVGNKLTSFVAGNCQAVSCNGELRETLYSLENEMRNFGRCWL
ncbi:unnamed protein product [Linum tenue]|uniref:Uncharacterized protein n=6 Tax=Linum tenue TaxID=586396 RepID=A0AAV0P752_9ROSI|nr:unnamed protein product [Linum tenue]